MIHNFQIIIDSKIMAFSFESWLNIGLKMTPRELALSSGPQILFLCFGIRNIQLANSNYIF